MAGRPVKLSPFEKKLRFGCYIISIFYIIVFATNFTLLLIDRPWEDSTESWSDWHLVDAVMSAMSVFSTLFLLSGTIWMKYHLLLIFLIWAVVCLVLSALVLAFSFIEYKQEEIVVRCAGIVITAYFMDIVFLFYLTLRRIEQERIKRTKNQSLQTLENDIIRRQQDATKNIPENGQQNNERTNSNNICQWYEDTKL